MTRRSRNSATRTFARTLLYTLLLSSLLAVSMALPSAARADGWLSIVEGIDYREYIIAGPNRIFVTRMDRSNPNVTLETSIAKQRLSDGKQTVSKMAEAYDGALSAWQPTWGSRMDVVAAINGSFHDTKTGVPLSGMVHSGWYAKRFDDLGGGSGFAWRLDREAFIGACVAHEDEEQILTFLESGRQVVIDGINSRRRRGSLVVYTPQWGARTPTSAAGTEVLVQMDVPAGILSWPDMATGTVTEVRPRAGRSEIPFDHVVLSAAGRTADLLEEQSHVGARVGLSSEVRHYEKDCEARRGDSWSETYAALSGSFEFLLDGEIQTFDDIGATSRHPRTAICYNDDYLFFVVVDGRSGRSVGMTMQELGRFCRDSLQTRWGINQDGGGSSTLWVDGEVVNRPSDGRERAVANGLMMVVVEPPEHSNAFQPGDEVQALELFDFSLGPGYNYETPADVHAGDVGTVLSHPHGLGGILATGQHWWLVDFQGRIGWAAQDKLLPLGSTPAPDESEEPDIPASFARFEAELRAGGPIKLFHWSPAVWLR